MPTFLYDGDCAFCSTCARFIDRWIRTPARVLPWQFTALEPLGLTADECEGAVQWVDATPGVDAARGTRPVAGPEGIARLLRSAEGGLGRLVWRPAGAVLGTRPILALTWPAYRWVARNRHRMPGGTAACSLSQAARERRRAAGIPDAIA